MLTFLICKNFVINAFYLDNKRLGSQRYEAVHIINVLQGKTTTRVNHPIIKAWVGYIPALMYYTNCIIKEWIRRGFENNYPLYEIPKDFKYPWWTQWPRLHHSHRAMLLRKRPLYFADKFIVVTSPNTPLKKGQLSIAAGYMDHGYIWPASLKKNQLLDDLDKICAPIPKELVDPKWCKATKSKGDPCENLAKVGDYCGVHKPR